MKKNKISLESMRIKSFVVSFDKDQEKTVKGGSIWCGPESIDPDECQDFKTTIDDGCWW